MNIGVTPDTRSTKAWVAETECRARQRIGFLRPERQDHWYRYLPKDPASVERAVAEARADIEAHALPYLSQRSGDFPRLLLWATSAMQAHVTVSRAFDRLWRRITAHWPFNTGV
ncbi:DUF4304 domain-containing protein [Sinorhizobium fredii]|uniref:DUF4304 domain-containing protein n=1 Tax=Rhizobium fredii TaxID=380 RepID=UPI0032B55294